MSSQNSNLTLSRRIEHLHASPIREILSVINQPGMISFAGGLPAPETFPSLSLEKMPTSRLQYGPTEGDPALRARVANDLNALGLKCTPDQVLILSGSQQGIDLVAKLFIDAGTSVAVESPTYLAALQVFRYFGARFTALDPRQPDAGLADQRKPAFAYAIPTFQNPTGHCYSLAARQTLAHACDDLSLPLFEDDPYRDLVYDACDRTPICTLIKRAPWIYQSSFSKSLAPGLRLGYLVASEELMPYLIRLKQAADLHSNQVSQWLVLKQLEDTDRPQRIAHVVDIYRRKRDIFEQGLAQHFKGLATWRQPAGGLFFWLTLNRMINTRSLLPEAIKRKVAFMPGEPFFADNPQACGAIRLNFSHATEAQISQGLAILAEICSP